LQQTTKELQCLVFARMEAVVVTLDCHIPVTVGMATGDLTANMNQTLALPIPASMERPATI